MSRPAPQAAPARPPAPRPAPQTLSGPRFDLVIFDFDGVLAETVEVKTRAFAALARELGGEAAAQALTRYHRAHGGVSRVKKFEWLFAEVLGQPLSQERLADLCARFAALVAERMVAEPMVPGAREALTILHGRVPLAVASGMPHEELGHILEKRGLAPFFFAFRGTPPAKADLVADLVHKAHVQPARALMVGDSVTDLEAARLSGCAFYGRGCVDAAQPWHDDLTRLAGHVLGEEWQAIS